MMHWLCLAIAITFSTTGSYASESGNDDTPSLINGAELAPGVIVSAIPAPALVTEARPIASLNAGKKIYRAKKKPLPTMMLSRTERRQIELLAVRTKPGSRHSFHYNNHDDSQTGLDELDLHRSYSRPKVAEDLNDDETDTLPISDHARLRLLFARLKALEAHVLNQVPEPDEPLNENVLLRLKQARLKAVQAHQERFS